MRKGKVKFYSIIESSEDYQQHFSELGEISEVAEEMVDGMEKFVCDIYSNRSSPTFVMPDMLSFDRSMLPKICLNL
jgi:hypothetical protein